MTGLSLYQEIFKQQKLDYAVCDAHRRLIEYSPGLMRYVQRVSGPLRGQPIENLFDLLAGMEPDLDRLICKQIPIIAIEKIYHRWNANKSIYFSVRISPYQNGLLLLIVDVTEEALLEQRVIQQRNELDLLSAQLIESRAQLDNLLHRFIPAPIADQIILSPLQVKLGGEKRQASALFADMRGFTGLAEWMEPEMLMETLNRHFSVLGQAVFLHGGLITNYAGDLLMAVFNALDDQPDHALRAVRTGIEIQQALSLLQQKPQAGMPFSFDFGIGINSGECVLGYLGFENRFEYTALGENINIASRLSGAASAGQILMAENTYQQIAGQVNARALGEIHLRGHREAVLAYEVLP